MTLGRADDDLVEVAVADDHEPHAAAVKVAPLARDGQQRRVHDQLLEKKSELDSEATATFSRSADEMYWPFATAA